MRRVSVTLENDDMQCNNPPFPHILVVDDDALLQTMLGELLSVQGYHITPCFSGEELETFLQAKFAGPAPDLIVLDVQMPGKNGLYWCQWLNDNHPNIPILMLSSRNSADARIAGLERGAADYLPKPFHTKELLLRIRNLLHNRAPKPPAAPINICKLDVERQLFIKNGKPTKLTTVETLMLAFFFRYKGTIITRDAISQMLRGNDHHPTDRSIDVHINRIRNKIEDDPANPHHLTTAWGRGYRFVLDHD